MKLKTGVRPAIFAMGRVTQVTMPRGDDNNTLTTSVQTNYAGTITTVTDQAGKQRRQKTDALGRIVRLDEPDASGSLGNVDTPAQATTYEYDTLDNLIHITQGSQQRYFKYDSLSRLTYERQVEQDAPWTTSDYVAGNNQWSRKVIYNSQGQVQDAYDARQVRTQFLYDGMNRVTQINYFRSDGSADPATPTAYYYYDSQLPPNAPSFDRGYSTGRLVAMTYGGATSTTGNYFGYDQMGRVATQRQVTGSSTYVLNYAYNLGGELTSESYPSTRVTNNAYDEAGRLSAVTGVAGATYASGFTYAAQGGLSAETLGNGMVHSLSYNRRLQATEVKLKQSAAGAELQRFNYAYGQVNQADGSVDTSKNNGQIARVDGYLDGTKQWDQRMSYDSLARLSTAAEYRGDTGAQTWQAHYDFDRFGNRFQYQSNSNVAYTPVQTSEIDPARNRFLSATTYDPAGNILSDAKFRGQYESEPEQGWQRPQ